MATLLTGCGEQDGGDSGPKKVNGEAAPAPGDSPRKSAGGKTASPSDSAKSGGGKGDKGSGGDAGGSSGSGGGSGSTGGGGSDGGSGSSGGGGGGGGGACKTSQLGFRTTHGMGEGTLIVDMKNNGSASCTLNGFPGADLQGEGGSLSAARSNLAPSPVDVPPGQETRFSLHYPPNDTGGTGATMTSLVVTPPGETQSRTLPVSINLPVTDSATGQIKVDPVGSGK